MVSFVRAQDYFDTYAYTYDNGGNILSVTKNGEAIKTYGYGDTNWKDLLTDYNGQTITYDTIGNSIQYRDGFNFSWSNGRQLSTVINGENSYSYTYNADSLRTSKTVNGVTTNYYWSNGILQAQKTGDEYLIFLYDENGSAYGFLLKNGTTEEKYYYLFNAQGDVIGIVDSNGSRVVEYYYDTWGNLTYAYGTLASTIGQLNPIRYRGYYYDAETGFYYLQSRYYDPEICRFINADSLLNQESILGYNMFAYCGNNPVNYFDPTGAYQENIADKFFAEVGLWIGRKLHDIFSFNKRKPNKYSADNLNIYKTGDGQNEEDKINVEIDPNHKEGGKSNPNIKIYDSHKITHKEEREQILKIIVESEEFDSGIYKRSISSWMKEWNGHNILYVFLENTPLKSNLSDVDLDENDKIIWEVWPR